MGPKIKNDYKKISYSCLYATKSRPGRDESDFWSKSLEHFFFEKIMLFPSVFYILSLFWFRVMTLTWALQVMCLQRSQRTRNCWHCPVSQKNRSTNSQMVCRISLFIPKITEIILLLLKLTTIGRIFNACDISQRPRIDLNKRCLPRPNTTTAWKLIP